MSKAKVKVKIQSGKYGTLLARVPVAVSHTDRPQKRRLFQTQAQMNIHIRSGQRP